MMSSSQREALTRALKREIHENARDVPLWRSDGVDEAAIAMIELSAPPMRVRMSTGGTLANLIGIGRFGDGDHLADHLRAYYGEYIDAHYGEIVAEAGKKWVAMCDPESPDFRHELVRGRPTVEIKFDSRDVDELRSFLRARGVPLPQA